MSQYYSYGVIREIDDWLVAEWIEAGNPKADGLVLVPAPPTYDAKTQTCAFDGSEWVIAAKPAEQIAAELAEYREGLSCSPAQGRLSLLQADLLDTVETWIAAQPRAVQIEYESRSEWRRTWSTIIDAIEHLGWSDEQADQLFEVARTL